MKWRDSTALRILLVCAKFIAQDEELKKEIQTVANHINSEHWLSHVPLEGDTGTMGRPDATLHR